MENQVLVMTKKDLEETFKKFITEKEVNKPGDFESEKLTISEAAKLAGMSLPTFHRRVSDGLFKKYGSGRKVFFIKSEMIETLRSSVFNSSK